MSREVEVREREFVFVEIVFTVEREEEDIVGIELEDEMVQGMGLSKPMASRMVLRFSLMSYYMNSWNSGIKSNRHHC